MGYRAKPERERCRALAQEERLPRMRRGGTATSLMTVEGSNGPEQEISAKRSQFLKRAASFPQCLRLVDAPTGRFFCQTKPVFHDAATGVFEWRRSADALPRCPRLGRSLALPRHGVRNDSLMSAYVRICSLNRKIGEPVLKITREVMASRSPPRRVRQSCCRGTRDGP
jgi:hypothetical protein